MIKQLTILCCTMCLAISVSAQENQEEFYGIRFSTEYKTLDIQKNNSAVYEVSHELLDGGGSSVFIKIKENKKNSKELLVDNDVIIDSSYRSNENKLDLVLYPNPVSDFLKLLNNTGGVLVVTFYNFNGDVIKSYELSQENTEVPTHKFKKGVLLYDVKQSGKVIKKGSVVIE